MNAFANDQPESFRRIGCVYAKISVRAHQKTSGRHSFVRPDIAHESCELFHCFHVYRFSVVFAVDDDEYWILTDVLPDADVNLPRCLGINS